MNEAVAATGVVRHRAIRRVTVIGAVVNLLLAIGKIVAGVLGHSQALIADGVHSLSDLFSDAMVVIASRHANRGADADHPYGHGRIETAVTVALGGVLMLVAVGIAWDAGHRLFNPDELLQPGMLALVAAALSVLAKEVLYHYTLHVGRKVRSNLVRANAWHHRTDAISSLVVIVGVAGAMAGLTYLDAVAAIVVAAMIARVGWKLGWEAVRELVDTALEPEQVEAIRAAIIAVPGVVALHELRTRRMGAEALVDVHVMVAPTLSVSEGHYISEAVRLRVIREIDEIADVMVHIDPEDDMVKTPSAGLPPRQELLDRLFAQWQGILAPEQVEHVTLHYLDGRIAVELLLPLTLLEAPEDGRRLAGRLRAKAAGIDKLEHITVHFH